MTNNLNSDKKPRIEWIDLAKGFCILFVVSTHVYLSYDLDDPLNAILMSVRMPLYFVLSGLFFKQYEGFKGFVIRKTNKLIIPFLFFLLLTSFIPVLIIDHKFVFLDIWYKRRITYNGPIWFLLCLFEVNVLFYITQLTANRLSKKHKVIFVMMLSFILGFLGLILSIYEINIPLFVDTAFTATPLFAFGWLLFRHTKFIKSPVNFKRDIPLFILSIVALFCFAGSYHWWINRFLKEEMWMVYPACIAGPMAVLVFSKMASSVPHTIPYRIISYWGRYSIMILCIHSSIILFVSYLLKKTSLEIHISLVLIFVTTMLICHFLIPLMKKYLPYVTAQKDLIKV